MGHALMPRQRPGPWLGALAAGLLLAVAGSSLGAEKQRIFVADGHRYVPGKAAADTANSETGLALCGIRCNALSGYYDSYLMSPGWRMIKVAEGSERTVDLKNPFLGGHCICSGDEYEVELYYYRPSEARTAVEEPRGEGTADD